MIVAETSRHDGASQLSRLQWLAAELIRSQRNKRTPLQDQRGCVPRTIGLDATQHETNIVALRCAQFRRIVDGAVGIIVDPGDPGLLIASRPHHDKRLRIKLLQHNPFDAK